MLNYPAHTYRPPADLSTMCQYPEDEERGTVTAGIDTRIEPGKVLKYGIIGVGMMGREHLYNLAALPGAMVVAVADPHPGSREAALAATAGLQSCVPSPPLQVHTHSQSENLFATKSESLACY